MQNNDTARPKGRPLGRQHDCKVSVRIPWQVMKVLKAISKKHKVPIAALIRRGIDSVLALYFHWAVSIARDEKRAPSSKIRAIGLLDQLRKAELSLTPIGLKLAREAAKTQKTKSEPS